VPGVVTLILPRGLAVMKTPHPHVIHTRLSTGHKRWAKCLFL